MQVNFSARMYPIARRSYPSFSSPSSGLASRIKPMDLQATGTIQSPGISGEQSRFPSRLAFLQEMAKTAPEYARTLEQWHKAWNDTTPSPFPPGIPDPLEEWKKAVMRPATDPFNAIIIQSIPRDNSDLCGIDNFSPMMQLDYYYNIWAEKHPKILPDSQGLTDENIAYLREHYSGELSAGELMDVVDTLKKMKIVSHDEAKAIYGGKTITGYIKDIPAVVVSNLPTFFKRYQQDYEAPIVHCRTVDDVFDWLKKRREETDPFAEEQKRYEAIQQRQGEWIEPPDSWYLRMEDEDLISRDLSLDAWFTSKECMEET